MPSIDHRQLRTELANANARWQATPTWLHRLTDAQRKQMLGVVVDEADRQARVTRAEASSGSFAPEVNWGVRGKVTPVRDQGGCGSCVSFGTVALLESMIAIEKGQLWDLSEADEHFCSSHGQSCGGWWPTAALDQIRTRGVCDEACFPYSTAFNASGPHCILQPTRNNRAFKAAETDSLSAVGARKEWLTSVGPMAAVFDVYDDFFSYGSGVYHHVTGALAGSHCVLVVGYSESLRCWICKNSWGAQWGDKGFFKIAYGECGIDSTYPFWGLRKAVVPNWVNVRSVPGWFGSENQGADLAVADLCQPGKPDLLVFHLDNPSGENHGYFRIGRKLDQTGAASGGWTPPLQVPGWFGAENQGAGIAFCRPNGVPCLVAFHLDNPGGENHGYYRVGRNVDSNGVVHNGWTPVKGVPGWFGAENQGGGIAIADISGNGKPDLVVFHVDNPGGENHGYYRIGWDLDADGNVSAWTPPLPVPGWFGAEDQGAGIAIADINGNGRPDLLVFHIDNPGGENHGYYRIGWNLNASGQVTGGWSPVMAVPGWFGAENQGAGVALADIDGDGRPELIVLHVDNPPGENRGYYRIGWKLDVQGNVTGAWF